VQTDILNRATVVKPDLKAYSGGVFKDAAAGATKSILCETVTIGAAPVDPTNATATGCPATTAKALN
jgi:hypothetical protein